MASPLTLFYSDNRILDLIRSGNEEGLLKLYQQNRKMVVSYIVKNNGTQDDAEDMLQESLIVLWERVRTGKYEQAAKLSTFIYATVKNLWSRRLAKTRREIPKELDGDDYANGNPNALDDMIDREQVELVKDCMKKLGEQCRRLLLMFYWEELAMDQIASEMGFANAETAKAKKYQCKKQLERIMRGFEAG